MKVEKVEWPRGAGTLTRGASSACRGCIVQNMRRRCPPVAGERREIFPCFHENLPCACCSCHGDTWGPPGVGRNGWRRLQPRRDAQLFWPLSPQDTPRMGAWAALEGSLARGGGGGERQPLVWARKGRSHAAPARPSGLLISDEHMRRGPPQ